MTNHNPTITSSAATGSFSEDPNTTDSGALHLLSGTMNFKDSDSHDTHTTSANLKSAVLSSGSVIPADALAQISAAMSSTILVDSNSSGKLQWSFSAADEAFDFLAKNQKLTLTYDIVLYDNHGGMTKKTVTVTVTGTDDRPVIDFGVNAVVTEQAGQTLSLSPDVAQIAVHFVDPDLTNTGHTASVIDVSASGATGGLLPGILGELELRSFFHIDNVVKTSGSSNGTINATFSAPDLAFDYLAEGETVDIVYTIKLNDNAGMNNTQTVTVTVVGTNDGPHYLSGPDTDHLVEGEDLSPAGDLTACGDFLFADIDLSDQHTVAASVTASRSGGGAVPLTEAQLLAALSTEVDPDSTSQLLGEVDWAFALDNDDVAFLNAGETLTLTYTVTITDDAGGTDTQTITVTILGVNSPVVVTSDPGAASVTEAFGVTGSTDPNPDPAATGTITFTDADLGDSHTVGVTVASAVWSGGPAVPAATEAGLGAAMLTILNDSTGSGSGSVDWSFSIPDFELDFLASGETLDITYTIEISDNAGESGAQSVVVTVEGSNDGPAFLDGPDFEHLRQGEDLTPTGELTASGDLSFDDVDLSDAHAVVTSVTATRSGGGAVPLSNADLLAALSTSLTDSTGDLVGAIDWNFSLHNTAVSFLSNGETVTISYSIIVSDGAGSFATQTVTIDILGTSGDNSVPVFTSGPGSGSVQELVDTTGSTDPSDPAPAGTLAFTDVDLDDIHFVDATVASAIWSANPSFVIDPTLADALLAAFTTSLDETVGTGTGSIDWEFAIADHYLDFLAFGETLTVTYDVALSDPFTSVIETVTITLNGAQDDLVVNDLTASIFDSSAIDTGSLVAAGNLIADAGDVVIDFSTTLSITDVGGVAIPPGDFIAVAGAYGTLFVFSDGFYQYVANSALDLLAHGQTATEEFEFTVSDNFGRDEPATLTFDVTGADDAPTITAAVASGTVTEDLGPTLLVNGSFEAGNLTGWSASSASIQAQFLGLGGTFGNYSVVLGTTASTQSLSQSISTVAGEHYSVSFYVVGESEADSNALTATWGGATLVALTNVFGGVTQYTFDVVGNGGIMALAFSYFTNGNGLFLDQVNVASTTGTPTATTDGSISFADIETGDAHTASFTPLDTGYLGTFSLGPLTEAGGSGSVAWHFTVNNAAIQFLSQGQTVSQVYTVAITGDFPGGATAFQDVSVTLVGSNDAPTAVGNDTVITNTNNGVGVFIPGWALTVNDTDPDMLDTLNVNNITASSGGSTFLFGDVFFIEDVTPGASFDYRTTDGTAVSSASGTATIINNGGAATTLTGTSGDDIVIAAVGGVPPASVTLDGGAGNDILVANSGLHSMTGGSGDDIFAFQAVAAPGVVNTITDFDNVTDHDMLAVSSAAFGGGLLTPGMDPSLVFESSADGEFFGSFFHYDETAHMLYYSADGTTASAVVVAQFQPGVFFHVEDMMIV